jgi:hypothetical protein
MKVRVREHMGPNSRLITTAFHEVGYNSISDLVSETGYDVKLSGLNPHVGKEIFKDSKFDKYVIVATNDV